MTIYIETFLFQNFLINFCLIYLVKTTTKSKSSLYKLILSSIVGASFGVFVVMFIKNNILINAIKLICAFLMIKLAFKSTVKQHIFNFILLFIYTYALGGFITAISSATYITDGGIIVSSKFSLELICLIIITLTYIMSLVLKQIKYKISTNNLIYPIMLYLGGKSIKINAYFDTGNLLNYQGCPIVVINLTSFLKLKQINIIEYLNLTHLEIQANTVAGKNNLKMFKIDRAIINYNGHKKEISSPYIAINSIFNNKNYDAIFGPNFIN